MILLTGNFSVLTLFTRNLPVMTLLSDNLLVMTLLTGNLSVTSSLNDNLLAMTLLTGNLTDSLCCFKHGTIIVNFFCSEIGVTLTFTSNLLTSLLIK